MLRHQIQKRKWFREVEAMLAKYKFEPTVLPGMWMASPLHPCYGRAGYYVCVRVGHTIAITGPNGHARTYSNLQNQDRLDTILWSLAERIEDELYEAKKKREKAEQEKVGEQSHAS